jgi:hypothetical protein
MNRIVIISIHGLIRGENMELGRDSDTGGQVTSQIFTLNNTYRSILSIILKKSRNRMII